jgi:hypothetical protein
VTFDPSSPGTPTPTPITIDSDSGVFGVACPSITQCTAVDGNGQEVTFDPSSPGTPTPITIDSGVLHSVACPSSTQCTAVDYYNGWEVTFDPSSPGTPTPITIDSGNYLTSVACPSITQCTAVDGNGSEVTFDPSSPGTPTPITIDSGNYLYALACVSSTQCTAVDDQGQGVTFNPSSPGTPTPTMIDSNSRFLRAVACPSSTQCTTVDIIAHAVTFNPSSPGSATLELLPGASTLTGVSCSSVTLCVAVDGSGHAFVGTASTDTVPPSISITAPTGAYTLNQPAQASYSCSDDGSGVASCAGPVASMVNFDTSSIGLHTFTVNAQDNVGNFSSASSSYSVLYSTGSCLGSPGHTVLPPVKPDGSSVFKLGSTVPVKFRVCDANGVSIGTAGIVTGSGAPVLYSKTNGAGGVDEPVYSTTPNTAFRWDATDQQWIFNQSTENLTSGVIYTYRINLNDGSYIQYTFGVK